MYSEKEAQFLKIKANPININISSSQLNISHCLERDKINVLGTAIIRVQLYGFQKHTLS